MPATASTEPIPGNVENERLVPIPVQRTRLLAAGAALVSGLLLAAAFRPLSWHFLAWVALVPWLLVLPRLRPSGAYLGGFLLALVFYRIGLHWAFAFAGSLAAIVLIVLAIWMGLSFRVARFLMDRFGEAAMLWAVPFAFVGQEVIRSEGLSRFRFGFVALGYSQSYESRVAQIASLGGVYSLSFLIVLANGAIAWAILRRTRRSLLYLGIVIGAVLILAWVSQPSLRPYSRMLSVACVQNETDLTQPFIDLTRKAIQDSQHPRIIVLPEHTITTWADERDLFVRGLSKLAKEGGVYICVGGHARPEPHAVCDFDNVGLLIGPDGKIIGSQSKSVPLPFFEDGNPARSQRIFLTPEGTLGVYVCYDGLFTDVPRRLAGLGAEVFLVPCMDPARWPAQERWQHADMAPYRSIELRRSAVRAGSSGISQLVDPAGRVLASRADTDGPGIIVGSVPLSDDRTVFAGGGYLFAPLVAVAYLGAIVVLTLADWWCGAKRLIRRYAGNTKPQNDDRSLTHVE